MSDSRTQHTFLGQKSSITGSCFKVKIYCKGNILHVFKIILKRNYISIVKGISNPFSHRTDFSVFVHVLYTFRKFFLQNGHCLLVGCVIFSFALTILSTWLLNARGIWSAACNWSISIFKITGVIHYTKRLKIYLFLAN